MIASQYYKEKIYVAQVDKRDNIVEQVERWDAHKNGILHRGFTAILVYRDRFLLQHRKHPAFDGVWDLTFSSHQIYKNGMLQKDCDAIAAALEREWNMQDDDMQCTKIGSVYYKAKDPNSIFTEHEIDYVYVVPIGILPHVNTEFAYGYELIDRSPKKCRQALKKYQLAPWVEKILEEVTLHFNG